ncbi:ROK family protein [Brachybacterium fresconis]|uniref:NBD/HSP70 family sugar kinase n=1 Tax=Brachybacterium fresconis TaxID=173363 RepID=A0ABS4YND0_9MICO|nr:putative NBD/HSP70 family sugar kinase [Brachybacterium fresconis]
MSTLQDPGASSPQLLRRANRQALLQYALRTGTFSAADAMTTTGLTRATVLGVCADLHGAGWLAEVEPDGDGTRRGRPARRYELRADAGLLIGVDAGEHTLAARAVDLRGRELASEVETVEIGVDDPGAADARREQVRGLLERLRARSGAGSAHPLLTVVGVPAPVGPDGLSPHGEAGYWPVMNPDLGGALNGEVLTDNDANLAVTAEHALRGGEHLATLLMGERFGAGLIIDGRLLHGALGGAGEMRFLDDVLVDSRGADGVAALARRWTTTALEAGARSPALEAIPADRLTAVDVFDAARAGDAVAQRVLERIGERIARIAGILASLLGVETVVVAGAIAGAIGPVLVHAREALPQVSSAPYPQLVASELGGDVVVRGAVETALRQLRENPLEVLGSHG